MQGRGYSPCLPCEAMGMLGTVGGTWGGMRWDGHYTHLHECLHGALRYVQHGGSGAYEGPLVHGRRSVEEEHYNGHGGAGHSRCHEHKGGKFTDSWPRATQPTLHHCRHTTEDFSSLTSNKPSELPTTHAPTPYIHITQLSIQGCISFMLPYHRNNL